VKNIVAQKKRVNERILWYFCLLCYYEFFIFAALLYFFLNILIRALNGVVVAHGWGLGDCGLMPGLRRSLTPGFILTSYMIIIIWWRLQITFTLTWVGALLIFCNLGLKIGWHSWGFEPATLDLSQVPLTTRPRQPL